jgi:hypothetical protein
MKPSKTHVSYRAQGQATARSSDSEPAMLRGLIDEMEK